MFCQRKIKVNQKQFRFSLAPPAADLEIQEFAGLHHSMDTFVGRGDKSS